MFSLFFISWSLLPVITYFRGCNTKFHASWQNKDFYDSIIGTLDILEYYQDFDYSYILLSVRESNLTICNWT